jgi:ABC-type transport system involved in Fe-S cluster assembly fused permease/ATPase subunit
MPGGSYDRGPEVHGIVHTHSTRVVAHRLSTVTMADRIVVIDAGRGRAVGTHTELLAPTCMRRAGRHQFLVAAD